jgi:thiol:disulfide interchange protein DsbC
MKSSRILLTVLLLAFFTVPAGFAESDEHEAAIKRIRGNFPELANGGVEPTPVPGLYEVRIGAQVSYVSADGRYLLQGDLFDAENEVNLTEARRTVARVEAVDDVGESSMIIFGPADSKRTITVFTDIDCGYCRKLHRNIDGYNELGIRVRYMFYPRSGPQTESWFKAESVWCSDDRNAALTRAKSGGLIKEEDCESTPVEQHYRLGKEFGIQGTPAIISDTGELIGGYLSPEALAKRLGE